MLCPQKETRMTSMIYQVMVDEAEAARITAERAAKKRASATHRPMKPGYELIGVMGELALGQFLGLPVGAVPLVDGGDGGVDFEVAGLTIDVKCSDSAGYLLVDEGKVRSKVYALAHWHPLRRGPVLLYGWEWGHLVAAAPVDTSGRFSSATWQQSTGLHAILNKHLRDLAELHDITVGLSYVHTPPGPPVAAPDDHPTPDIPDPDALDEALDAIAWG